MTAETPLVEPPLVEGVLESFRWWFLPSWLGLDAPCVVLTWTWAASRAAEVALPVLPAVALFLVVWSIYLSDRLIDVARCRDWSQATGRLRFGRDWRWLFIACLGVCLLGIAAVLAVGLPAAVIVRAGLVAIGVGLHFLLFVIPSLWQTKLPGKEFGVGLFFALGAAACLGVTTAMLPLFVSIAAVVAFNCLVIAARDAASDRANDPGGASHWWPTIDRDLFWIGILLAIAAVVSAVATSQVAFFASVAAAFALLTVLHRVASRLSGDSVRALADYALLTPMVVILLV
jgi:hypothetical protein